MIDASSEGDEGIESQSGIRRLALVVEYEGAGYSGFQVQAHEPTIQGELERAIYKLTKEKVRVRGASRTDAGAHALGQVVDFETRSRYPPETFVGALNYHLPIDIRILHAAPVDRSFNSRRDALSRTYRYRILNRPSPPAISRRHSHWEAKPLNLEYMKLAARFLVGVHDFRPFAPGHPRNRSAVRRVERWDVTAGSDDKDIIDITCEANGFMQHQIRRTNAVLATIGKGLLPLGTIGQILENEEGNSTGISMGSIPILPAKGLCLVKVKYKNSW